MTPERIARAIALLDAWLETMRQEGGYGGPVAHWWQHRFQYTGPGLDWRYEGILAGYAGLLAKAPDDDRWLRRLESAAHDLIRAQRPDGSYPASRFEINPGTTGTPHEAAATLGLLEAAPHLSERERAVETAERSLRHLIDVLWDGAGFADRPGGRERVPNKLATLAAAFLALARRAGDEAYLPYARACLDDVLRHQVGSGRFDGAVHQYAPGHHRGDGRFFPYYVARCVPPLLTGAEAFGEPRYRAAAERIVAFLDRTMHDDGSWPQVVYADGRRAEWPRWIAGSADILLAYHESAHAPPAVAVDRLLDAQQPRGGFPTAQGFAAAARRMPASSAPQADVRDRVPVVGWNDKVLRLLAALAPSPVRIPRAAPSDVRETVIARGAQARYVESATAFTLTDERGEALYVATKSAPWAEVCAQEVNVR